MQEEITAPTPILDEKGHVIRPGWARDTYFQYDRSKIKISPLRIKEWDFWEVFNSHYRVVLNIFDIGFAGFAQFTFTDFETHESINAGMLTLFPKGKTGNPPSWRYEKPLRFARGKSFMEFNWVGNNILLKAVFPDALKKKGIKCEFRLQTSPNHDSMVNLIPFKNPSHFVYAVKMQCLPATGNLWLGERTIEFTPDNGSWGCLDWTRAIFPHKNQWKWCTGAGKVNGVSIGFNLDYGFGTQSSKNMIFYNGKGHHLDEIEYQHDHKHLDAPLKITGSNGRVDLVLHPKYIEKAGVDILLMAMKGISTYGVFTGTLILDSGEKIQLQEKDNVFGWAEEFYQKW
jgi:hypothetical protein